ncbi:hypothetical protein T484DRAFT_1877884, partial [Baffinella frigidus]
MEGCGAPDGAPGRQGDVERGALQVPACLRTPARVLRTPISQRFAPAGRIHVRRGQRRLQGSLALALRRVGRARLGTSERAHLGTRLGTSQRARLGRSGRARFGTGLGTTHRARFGTGLGRSGRARLWTRLGTAGWVCLGARGRARLGTGLGEGGGSAPRAPCGASGARVAGACRAVVRGHARSAERDVPSPLRLPSSI